MIGIRKVLGASVLGIFLLQLKEFAKWVILANVIAWPLGYLVMDRWLKNFAYRTDIALWIFVASGVLGFAIAVINIINIIIKFIFGLYPTNILSYSYHTLDPFRVI